MEPVEPLLHSPLSSPLVKQRQLANALLAEMACTKMATEGMLLSNLEKDCKTFCITKYILSIEYGVDIDTKNAFFNL